MIDLQMTELEHKRTLIITGDKHANLLFIF